MKKTAALLLLIFLCAAIPGCRTCDNFTSPENSLRKDNRAGIIQFKIVKKAGDRFPEFTEEEIAEVESAWTAYEVAMKSGKNPIRPQYQVHVMPPQKEGDHVKKLILMNYGKIGSGIKTSFDGTSLASIKASEESSGRPAIAFEMDQNSSAEFHKMTKEYQNRFLAILINGQVRSAPKIMSPISGKGVIVGNFTSEEVESLVKALSVNPDKQ